MSEVTRIEEKSGPVKGFISYSHNDVSIVESMKSHFASQPMSIMIDLWYDRKIEPGTKWSPEIEKQLKSSELVVFCISESFLKSKACREEFRTVIKLKEGSSSEIVPVIMKECRWIEDEEISSYQAVPTFGKPIEEFEHQTEAFAEIEKALFDKAEKLIKRRNLCFLDSHIKVLRSINPLLAVSGTESLNFCLDDIYVDPEARDLQSVDDDDVIVAVSSLQEKLLKKEKLIVAGEVQSGKSSISRKFCLDLFAKNYFPVLLTGDEMYRGIPERIVERAIHQQYSDPTCITFDRVVLFLDDFNKCRDPEKFLRELPECRSVCLFVDTVYDLNLGKSAYLKEYTRYEIVPMRARKRVSLIKNWLRVRDADGRADYDNYKSQDRLMARVETTLGKTLGKGLIPAYPFYVLSILIASEVAFRPLNQEISSQGYCYQALLYAVLRKVGVGNRHMDVYVNFLTELAYACFQKSNGGKLSDDELEEFVKRYKDVYNLPIPEKVIWDTLSKAGVFAVDSLGNHDFSYPYLKYYFIGKYLAEHYKERHDDFVRIFSNLGSSSNSCIAIFIAHHGRSVEYLEELEQTACGLFKDVEPSYLSEEDLKAFDKRSDLIIQAALPSPSVDPEQERDRALQIKEKQEPVSATVVDDVQNEDREVREIIVAMRLSQVIGLIIKGRPGSIEKTTQKELITAIVELHAKLIRSFFDTFKDEATQQHIIDYLSYRLNKKFNGQMSSDREKLRKIAAKLFWNLNFSTTYGLLLHCASAIGSEDLFKVTKEACVSKSDAPISGLLPYFVEVMYKKRLDIDGMVSSMPKFPRTVRTMLRMIVSRFCATHHIGHKERQQAEALFNLKKTLPQYINSEKE